MNDEASIVLKSGLAVGYGESLGVVEEEIRLGEGTHYLVARNGRGKTTLLRTLGSAMKPLQGSFTTRGRVKFIPEDVFFNDHLPAKAIFRALVPASRLSACLEMAEQIELDCRKAYRALSTGNQRKVSMLVVEFSQEGEGGEVLLLDEPFTGLDSYVREVFLNYWQKNCRGVCRLVSCHPDFDSMDLSSVMVISGGKIYSKMSEERQTWRDLREQLV